MRALQLTIDMSQRWLFGKAKYRHGVLVAIAVFSHPCSHAVLTLIFAVPACAVDLDRFVLLGAVADS